MIVDCREIIDYTNKRIVIPVKKVKAMKKPRGGLLR